MCDLTLEFSPAKSLTENQTKLLQHSIFDLASKVFTFERLVINPKVTTHQIEWPAIKCHEPVAFCSMISALILSDWSTVSFLPGRLVSPFQILFTDGI